MNFDFDMERLGDQATDYINASLCSFGGTAVSMALMPHFLTVRLAPSGMALMFFLGFPIGILYWVRHWRADRRNELIERAAAKVVELIEQFQDKQENA